MHTNWHTPAALQGVNASSFITHSHTDDSMCTFSFLSNTHLAWKHPQSWQTEVIFNIILKFQVSVTQNPGLYQSYDHCYFPYMLMIWKKTEQAAFSSVLHYRDVSYMHTSASTPKPLDTVYHTAIRFITAHGFMTHHCQLYQNAGWTSLALRRGQHCLLFIYEAFLHKLPV